jgi:hypothetical protein
MNLMPFHGCGGAVTPSALTIAQQARRAPRIWLIGSGRTTLAEPFVFVCFSTRKDCALWNPGASRTLWFCSAPHACNVPAPSKSVWKTMSPVFGCAKPGSAITTRLQVSPTAC